MEYYVATKRHKPMTDATTCIMLNERSQKQEVYVVW